MKLQKDLREFIESLNSHEVEFLVMGGHAVAYHGYPRLTGDLDIFVRTTPENARRVVAALEVFGFRNASSLLADLERAEKVIQLGRVPNRIDILTSVSGLAFEDAWRGSLPSQLDGVPVRFPSRASLLANKRASGRAKDLADVEELERRAGGDS